MKAKVNDRVRILVDVEADFSAELIPSGTEGVIVEVYEDPEGYAVDLAIPDDSLAGGYRYENVILRPEQFDVVKEEMTEES